MRAYLSGIWGIQSVNRPGISGIETRYESRVREMALRCQEQKENESNIQRPSLTHQVQRVVVGKDVKIKQ